MADTGHTVPELFAERGEAAFRAEEERVLAEALSGAPSRWWCRPPAGWCCPRPTGPCWPGRARWCGCGPTPACWPIGWGPVTGRPLLDDDPAAALVDLYEVRRPLYEAVADVVVDVDAPDPRRGGRRGCWPGPASGRGSAVQPMR